MKTPFVFCPWARSGLLLFVFITLPLSDAQCGPLGRALNAIKGRVDHALNKIGIRKDDEPLSPRETQDDLGTEAYDPRYAPAPMTDDRKPLRPAQRQPDNFRINLTENLDPSDAVKPSSRTRGRAQPPAATVTSNRRQQMDAAKAPVIKPSNDSSSRANATAGEPRSAIQPEATEISPAAKISYAKPVPGKRGFVYAPGVAEELHNILDVRGSAPGQKMRDPRTGNMFLVP